ncbi:MAG: aminotransferase class III-fold pyridoxal phosphate-dependent enzyme [Clostridia bacterium]|nr:aminotransferase class III-fold pyridoxal phosphate-dependent enzyme [Clostridia bacterium]
MTNLTEQSKIYNKKTEKYLAGGVHYNFRRSWDATKVHFTDGQGTRAWDLDGNEYLDFFCKFGANILGHKNPEYIDAIKGALDRVVATSLAYMEYDLCKKICEIFSSVDKVRFSLSGTEAVQNALRLARGYTGKPKFIRFISHYHGNSDNIMGGKPADNIDYYPVEYNGDPRGTYGRALDIMGKQSYMLPWNDAKILKSFVETHKDELAAIITEPICVNTKSMTPSSEYLTALRDLCTQNNIVLIFDEVITGFRVALGGAQSLFGIKPDLTILGKAVSGGAMPLSVIGGKQEIMDLYSTNKVTHGGTFNGYTLGLVAANTTIDILARNSGEIYKHMECHFSELLAKFKEAALHYGFHIDIHGHPTCSSFSCSRWEPNANVLPDVLETVISRAMFDHGILLSNRTTFYSNTAICKDDIDLFSSRLNAVFEHSASKLENMKV